MQQDPTLLRFGIEEVAALFAIVQGIYWIGEMSPKFYRLLLKTKKKNSDKSLSSDSTETLKNEIDSKDNTEDKDNQYVIVVQTPTERREFVPREDLTENEIQEDLEKLAGIRK